MDSTQTQTDNENYNETVLIPILQKRVNNLTTDTLLLEARLEIATKEKGILQKQVDDLKNEKETLNMTVTSLTARVNALETKTN